jgi:uncharacterized membrane protein YeaQ/YmgE (transglycosylase-associated protein family)
MPLLGVRKTDYAPTRLAEQAIAVSHRVLHCRACRACRLFGAIDQEATMHWLWVIIIGFLAGAIAKLFIAGPGGIIITTLLGIVGAIFATWLGQQIGWYRPGQGAGFIGAIVGAVLILAIYRAVVGPQP